MTPFGHVDERAAGPDRGVERGQHVVVGRDHGREVLADHVLVLAQRRVHVEELDAQLLEVLADLVVDDLGLVLSADAGQEAALGLGDAELVERVLDVVGDVVPARLRALGGADEVVDVVEVDLVEIGAPLRHRAGEEVVERLQPEVAHPLRLVLVLGDVLDELAAEPLRRLVDVAGLGIVEAELRLVVLVDVLDRLALGLLGVEGCGCLGWRVHVNRPPA